LVPLRWRGTLTGAMLLGPERTGRPYTLEDLEFLATVAEQAAGAIVTARLSETAAQSREFEAFTRLTSFVIHDLKNSVSALSMLAQNALTNFDDREFQQDAIRTLSRTVERMRGLLARLSASPEPAPLRLEPVDLSSLALDATTPLVGRRDVRLVRELPAVPQVLGDREALGRVVQNLVTNAVEALDGHGGEVAVRTAADAGHVTLAVSDTGCGIPEHFLRTSLFSPFKSTKKGGWGIGLYQSKAIVEAHGGDIHVTSTQGEGTTFVVRLPRPR
ncbi:MAG TPA: ATP-binding protein, partial [Candidatus Tectomicrobia bacterium]|nr:ATP-binding protein [Candidatus Tectomicrobia bacterium]